MTLISRVGISGSLLADGSLHWDWNDQDFHMPFEVPHIRITFSLHQLLDSRPALRLLREALHRDRNPFLRWQSGRWHLDLDALKALFPWSPSLPWATGEVIITPEIAQRVTLSSPETTITFIIAEDEMATQPPSKIFLSHKGANKPKVLKYHRVLQEIGLDPWYDEDALPAGAELERGLLAGMKASCAAVFFLTPEYQDDRYLAAEINYAIAEKRDRPDHFALISLVFTDDHGRRGIVPDLLRPYVWKQPSDDLDALREILRALPIRSTGVEWRSTRADSPASSQPESATPTELPINPGSITGEPLQILSRLADDDAATGLTAGQITSITRIPHARVELHLQDLSQLDLVSPTIRLGKSAIWHITNEGTRFLLRTQPSEH